MSPKYSLVFAIIALVSIGSCFGQQLLPNFNPQNPCNSFKSAEVDLRHAMGGWKMFAFLSTTDFGNFSSYYSVLGNLRQVGSYINKSSTFDEVEVAALVKSDGKIRIRDRHFNVSVGGKSYGTWNYTQSDSWLGKYQTTVLYLQNNVMIRAYCDGNFFHYASLGVQYNNTTPLRYLKDMFKRELKKYHVNLLYTETNN